MNQQLKTALDALRAAIENEGPEPTYHRITARAVEEAWPSLMAAVKAVLRAYPQGEK